MTHITLKGSCLCTSIAYETSGELVRFYHCHCQRCRKANGTGHSTNLMIKADTLQWLKGKELLKRYKVAQAERFYTLTCTHCASPMPREVPELGAVFVPAGSLDHELDIKPEARIFWDSRADWTCQGDGLAVFPEYPTLD